MTESSQQKSLARVSGSTWQKRDSSATGNNAIGQPDRHGIGQDLQTSFVMMCAAMAVSGMLMMVLFPTLSISIRLAATALVVLTLRHWGGIALLILVQLDLLMREGREFERLRGASAILLSVCVVGIVMFVFRQRERLNHILRRPFSDLWRLLGELTGLMGSPSDRIMTTVSGSILQSLARTLRACLVLLASVACAQWVLSVIPRGRALSLELRAVLEDNPTLDGMALMITAIVAGILVLNEISWRQMNRDQGRMYLRSGWLKLSYRDLAMVIVRRIRQRQKRLATPQRPSPPTT